MIIGILQCDQVETELITQYGTYPEMFVRLLQQAEANLTYTIYDVRRGELPKSIDAADAYLITGSRYSVNDNLPWISKLEGLVRSFYESRKKIIGICFGHQLIAKTLGGKVIKSPKGWGIGMSINKIIEQKPWMSPALMKLHLYVSHQDQVVVPPIEAEVLAASDFCPFYMFRIRDNFLTIQGHPEFSKAYTQALMMKRKKMYSNELFEYGLKSLEQTCDAEVFARWIINFLHE